MLYKLTYSMFAQNNWANWEQGKHENDKKYMIVSFLTAVQSATKIRSHTIQQKQYGRKDILYTCKI